MSISAEARRTIKLAEQIGFKYTGKRDNIGHLILEHENGTYTISNRPSDHRSHKNAIAVMERIAGKKTERVVRRKSRKPNQIAGYTRTFQTESSKRWSTRIDELLSEHKDLVLEFKIISMAEASRSEINRAMEIIRRLAQIEDFLTELQQPIPEMNIRTPTTES